MSEPFEFCVVLVTCSGKEEAERISESLVARGLAACVNVLPGCVSIYRWEGEVQHDKEALMIIKSRRSRFAELEACVRELHSYDVPEVIAVDLSAASRGYLNFLEDGVP
jgi:periplasmic divalent cation tolerance protein